MTRHVIDGHAIVSREGAIADARGAMPAGLRVEADWIYFQRQLDESDLTVLGRASHEAVPNRGRRRLVLTSAARGLVRIDALVHALDPSAMPIEEALQRILPEGGRVAVVGGRDVFDLFLGIGFDLFHLTVARECRITGGVPVFEGVSDVAGAMAKLREHGLVQRETVVLDRDARAVLHIFARGARD